MSTYNGGRFIKEQISSILNQKYDVECGSLEIHDMDTMRFHDEMKEELKADNING